MVLILDAVEACISNPIYFLYLAAVAVLLVHAIPYFLDPLHLRAFPGPLLAKFTDGWMGWIVSQGRWSETVDKLHRQHGTFVRLSPQHISVADPSAFTPIYGHSSGTEKAPFYDAFSNFRKRNVFNTRSRAEHARKRRVEAHMFAPQSVRALEVTSRVHLAKFVQQWDTLCSNAEKAVGKGAREGNLGSQSWKVRDGRVWFNCMPWFSFWSFDTIGDLAFGAPFGMLAAAKDNTKVAKSRKDGLEAIRLTSSDSKEHAIQMEEISVIETLTSRAETVSILGFLPEYWRPLVGRLPGMRRGYDAAGKLAGLSMAAVARRLAKNEDREDMLKRLLEGRDEEGKPMGPEELSAEAFVLIVAGADTIANTSCATTYYLARNPDVQAKLQAELDEVLGSLGEDVAPYEAVKDLPYLDAVVNEGLRLHSTVGAGLPRLVPPGGLNVLGHTFKEGTWVSVPIYNVHRSEAIWGENAAEFYPDRWFEANEEKKKEMLNAFAPFSVGPRACIGRNLALMQLHIILATMLHRYHFVLDGDAPLPVHDTLARKPVNCMIGMKRRNI